MTGQQDAHSVPVAARLDPDALEALAALTQADGDSLAEVEAIRAEEDARLADLLTPSAEEVAREEWLEGVVREETARTVALLESIAAPQVDPATAREDARLLAQLMREP